MTRHWYQDAAIYCVDVARFADSDGDGIGDLRGVIEHLDHIESLGADCVWLLPFFASPRRDDGYDVADHCAVDPRFGTLEDVDALVRELDRRGMRLMVDLVANHTSDEHPWFDRSRHEPGGPYRDYYVWVADGEERPPFETIFPEVERGAWEWHEDTRSWYLHHFYRFQPDLNPCCPAVWDELQRIVRFWGDRGISGLRIDAASHVVDKASRLCERDGGGHWVLRDLAAEIGVRCRDGVLMAEADVAVDELRPYFGDGDEIGLMLNFQACEHAWLALAREEAEPLRSVLRELPDPPAPAGWANFLRNHDELDLEQLAEDERREVFDRFAPEESMRVFGRGIRRRAATMLGGDTDLLALAHTLTIALPGVPVLVYGDEIGVGDDLSRPERQAVRLAMQWTPEAAGGFSTAPAERLQAGVRADGPYGYARVNVRDAERDPSSLLHRVRAALRARRESPELRGGRCTVLDADPRVLALRYDLDGSVLVAAHNLGAEPCDAALAGVGGLRVREHVLGERADTLAGLRLPPRGYAWVRATP